MTVTTATNQDWIDFWENEMQTESVTMSSEELRQLRDEIVEAIGVAFAIWGDGELDFEENAICGIVSDSFRERGIN